MTERRVTFSTNLAPSGRTLPYRRRPRLLSPGERRFYAALVEAVGDRYAVNLKARLLDLIEPTEGLASVAGRKISQRHVDFVLVDPKTTRVVACIELDDATHLTAERAEKDAYLAAALASAGVVLVRFPIYKRYEPERIRRAFLGAVGRSARPASAGEIAEN
ncbi:MAG: DUF2726 domain-containing protein [Lacipirellulaceae bacterium]